MFKVLQANVSLFIRKFRSFILLLAFVHVILILNKLQYPLFLISLKNHLLIFLTIFDRQTKRFKYLILIQETKTNQRALKQI